MGAKTKKRERIMKIPKSLYLVICDATAIHEIYWDSIAETRSESIRRYVSKEIGTIDPVHYWKGMATKCGLQCIKFERKKK